jgi:hypothetical protein
MTGHAVSVARHRQEGIDRCEIRVPGRPWAHLVHHTHPTGRRPPRSNTPPIRLSYPRTSDPFSGSRLGNWHSEYWGISALATNHRSTRWTTKNARKRWMVVTMGLLDKPTAW